MARALRITFNETDYNFIIQNTEPITRSTSEIPIDLGDQKITLIKSGNYWTSKDMDMSINQSVVEAIGRAISLRYRL